MRNLFRLNNGVGKAVIGLLVVVLFSSCIKDRLEKFQHLNGIRWKGNYAAPIVNAELNLEDAVALVNQEWVSSFPDKTLIVHYDKKHVSKRADEIYSINNRSFVENISPTQSELNQLTANGYVAIERYFIFDLAPGAGIQCDSIWLKEGRFAAEIAVNTNHKGKVTTEITDLLSNNATVSLNHTWNSSGAINLSDDHKVAGTESLNLTQGNLGYNQFRVKVTWEITQTGSINTGEQLQLTMKTEGLKFRKLYGNLGQPNLLTVQDSLDLSLFSNKILKGNIVFEDARINIRLKNGFGKKMQYDIQNLALQSQNGLPTAVTSYPSSNMVAAASDAGILTYSMDSVYISQATGSNVAAVMKTEPHSLAYSVSAIPQLGRGFIWDESQLELLVSVELPLYVSTKDLVLEDTSDLDLGIGEEGDYLEMIKFKMNAENGIPLGVGIQCYFMDGANQLLDSLFQPFRYILRQADVDAGGTVIAPSKDQWELVVEKPKLTNILKAKRLRTRAWIPTSQFNGNPIPVRISKDQNVKLKMGVEVKLSADAEL